MHTTPQYRCFGGSPFLNNASPQSDLEIHEGRSSKNPNLHFKYLFLEVRKVDSFNHMELVGGRERCKRSFGVTEACWKIESVDGKHECELFLQRGGHLREWLGGCLILL